MLPVASAHMTLLSKPWKSPVDWWIQPTNGGWDHHPRMENKKPSWFIFICLYVYVYIYIYFTHLHSTNQFWWWTNLRKQWSCHGETGVENQEDKENYGFHHQTEWTELNGYLNYTPWDLSWSCWRRWGHGTASLIISNNYACLIQPLWICFLKFQPSKTYQSHWGFPTSVNIQRIQRPRSPAHHWLKLLRAHLVSY